MANELKTRKHVPSVDNHGNIMSNVGRYARENVMIAFEMIGGVDAFAAWAEDNKTDFYTKLFPKIIGKEIEIKAHDSIETLLEKLDNTPQLENIEDAEVIDGD